MEKIITELENEIKKLSDISETVTFNNAGESLQLMGDKLDNFLIMHKAKLNAILKDVKILNGKTRKDYAKKNCDNDYRKGYKKGWNDCSNEKNSIA